MSGQVWWCLVMSGRVWWGMMSVRPLSCRRYLISGSCAWYCRHCHDSLNNFGPGGRNGSTACEISITAQRCSRYVRKQCHHVHCVLVLHVVCSEDDICNQDFTQKSIANFKQSFLYFPYFSWLNSFVTVPFPSLIRGWILLHYVGLYISIFSIVQRFRDINNWTMK